MKIKWLGHACFSIEQGGYRVIVDPYEGVPGYPELHAQAHAVYCSHGHHDHNNTSAVKLLPARDNPFTVRVVDTYHDDKRGALRGENAVRCFSAGGFTVVHLGDLGHLLSPAQAAGIGACDVLLVPVGGFFTIDAKQAKRTAEQLRPRTTVPMHYRHPPYGLPAVGGVEPFLALWSAGEVKRLGENSFEVTGKPMPKVLVPAFSG